ncbi:uncharacterized protein JCM15063_002333 [Sporobolomyces koalae]|uniref:uncharacterized protein n=1 Tax=Sporobolomyces koalae TaxID=500713 RepID=UPI00316D7C0C
MMPRKLTSCSLPYNAIPLHFALFRPLSGSSSPCAVLIAALPIRSTCSFSPASTTSSTVGDLTHGALKPSFEVYRLLDPELREPFVSIGRVFLACRITPVEGLLRYGLEKPAYDSTLGGIAPFYDIWVPLRKAREIALDLGVLEELAGLLELGTRKAWSVEDKEQGGMVHNWKIATDRIAPSDYSTQQMLSQVVCSRLWSLELPLTKERGKQGLFPSATPATFRLATDLIRPSPPSFAFDALFAKLVEWSVHEYEHHVDSSDLQPPLQANTTADRSSPDPAAVRDDDRSSLTPLFLFSTLAPLLALSRLIPEHATMPDPSRQLEHLSGVVLTRSDLVPSSSTTSGLDDATRRKGSVYLVDAVSRFALEAFTMEWERFLGHPRVKRSTQSEDGDPEERVANVASTTEIRSRFTNLERELESQGETHANELRHLNDTVQDLRDRIEQLERTASPATALPTAADGSPPIHSLRSSSRSLNLGTSLERTQNQPDAIWILCAICFAILVKLVWV